MGTTREARADIRPVRVEIPEMASFDDVRQVDAQELTQRLALAPTIAMPTITLEGDANGAPHPDPNRYAAKFTGPYTRRTIGGGVGHNLPQEASEAFADAVLEVGGGLR